MDKILSTIKIIGNEDLQSTLSSIFSNPKEGDNNWLLSQFYETTHDWDYNCVGTCTTTLSNSFIGDESVIILSSDTDFPYDLINRMCDIFREIDENFEVKATYEHSEYVHVGAFYGTATNSISSEKQLSSLLEKEDYESPYTLEDKVFAIKESILEECVEELKSENAIMYDGDYITDSEDEMDNDYDYEDDWYEINDYDKD
jgi:hypothetical protein